MWDGRNCSNSENALRNERSRCRFSLKRDLRSVSSCQMLSQYWQVVQGAAQRAPSWDKKDSQPDLASERILSESSRRFSPLHLLHATNTLPGTWSPARKRFMPSRCSITDSAFIRSHEQYGQRLPKHSRTSFPYSSLSTLICQFWLILRLNSWRHMLTNLFATSDLARRVAERSLEMGSFTFSHPQEANRHPRPAPLRRP